MTAADWLQNKIIGYFDQGLGQIPVWSYLASQGYTKEGNVILLTKKIKNLHTIPEKEWNCIVFLIEEWEWSTDWPQDSTV